MDAWPLDEFHIDNELLARVLTADDAASVFEVVRRNEHHLMEFMHWMVPDYSLQMAEEFIEATRKSIENKEHLGFGIFRRDRLLGVIGFVSFDWKARKTEIGYWIDKDEQGKGIISRASRYLIDYAFDGLDLNRIEIRCSSENLRSAAIPKRLGFRFEGHLRQSEFRNGKLHDFLTFGLLRSDRKPAEN